MLVLILHSFSSVSNLLVLNWVFYCLLWRKVQAYFFYCLHGIESSVARKLVERCFVSLVSTEPSVQSIPFASSFDPSFVLVSSSYLSGVFEVKLDWDASTTPLFWLQKGSKLHELINLLLWASKSKLKCNKLDWFCHWIIWNATTQPQQFKMPQNILVFFHIVLALYVPDPFKTFFVRKL